MNELTIFKNEQFGEMRTVTIGDEIWFVGKDVAAILGYKDTSDAMKRHVDDEDKLTRRFTDSGQNREMYIINESGLYSLVLSSKLPSAKVFGIGEREFIRWIESARLCYRNSCGKLIPYAEYSRDKKWFEVKEIAYGPASHPNTMLYTKITPLGRTKIFNKMRKAGII